MSKLILLIVFLIFSNHCFAHKPKVKFENYGNIKTYYISEFNVDSKTVSSEELKIEVIGKMAKIISEKLGYKDTIMIERKTYLTYNKNDLYILENDNSNYKIGFLDNSVVLKSNGKGLAIRIMSKKVNIKDVLKLVEYTINNRYNINKSLVSTPYFHIEDEHFKVLANSEELIFKILNKNSKLVDDIINEEILLTNNSVMKISWKNGEFVFGMNLDKFKPDNLYRELMKDQYKIYDFKYFINSVDSYYFIIFHDEETFSYFDGMIENTSQKIKIKNNDSWYPFKLGKEKIGTKIILYNSPEFFYVYSTDKKSIQKIE